MILTGHPKSQPSGAEKLNDRYTVRLDASDLENLKKMKDAGIDVGSFTREVIRCGIRFYKTNGYIPMPAQIIPASHADTATLARVECEYLRAKTTKNQKATPTKSSSSSAANSKSTRKRT